MRLPKNGQEYKKCMFVAIYIYPLTFLILFYHVSGKLFHQIFQEFRKKILSQMKKGNREMLKKFSKLYHDSGKSA